MTSRSATNPIALRYITEIQPCQEVAVPKASTRSATPNARLATASAARPISQRLSSDIGGRLQRWHEAVAGLLALRAEYTAWCDVPDSLRASQPLRPYRPSSIIDLDELTAIVPPRGYGRD